MRKTFKKTTESLIQNTKILGLTISEKKTKYMRVNRNGQRRQASELKDKEYVFEQVNNFTYLGINLST